MQIIIFTTGIDAETAAEAILGANQNFSNHRITLIKTYKSYTGTSVELTINDDPEKYVNELIQIGAELGPVTAISKVLIKK